MSLFLGSSGYEPFFRYYSITILAYLSPSYYLEATKTYKNDSGSKR